VDKKSRNSLIFSQVFDVVDIGLIVLDKDLRICHWNRWMQLQSGIEPDKIIGAVIFDFFPNLQRPCFLRNCKAVFTFGNFSFFSQKLHHYLFPLKPISSFDSGFKFMQQNCTMGPLRDGRGAIEYIFISVHDVTEAVSFEQRLLEMNMKDALTGINNRRCLEIRLREEIERHKRYAHPLSLIIFDIDCFKQINDTYGHQCGDYILTEVAATISKTIRSEDILARFGGDEFCCLLPETSSGAALVLAERFRKKIARRIFRSQNDKIKTTISLGVAALSEGDTKSAALLKKADDALYEAKNNGRNQVALFK